MTNTTHAQELDQGKRFAFGQNWSNFLRSLNDERILEAELRTTALDMVVIRDSQ